MQILDLGTGGGFPGIPLAILFPETRFYLVDSIQKKIKVVQAISQELKLTNVTPLCQRAETLHQTFDFILSRAVTSLPKLYNWTKDKIKPPTLHITAKENEAEKRSNIENYPKQNVMQIEQNNGLLCWKGGNLTQELANLPTQHRIYPLKHMFNLPFFNDKSIVHLFGSTFSEV